MATVDERGTTGGYTGQDKFWVQGTPNGRAMGVLWERHIVDACTNVATAQDRARQCRWHPSSPSAQP